MYYTWIRYCSRRYCKKLHAGPSHPRNWQHIVSASRTDLQILEILGKMASPSCLSAECPQKAFVVGEIPLRVVHARTSLHTGCLILTPAHYSRVALPSQPRLPRYWTTYLGAVRATPCPKILSLSSVSLPTLPPRTITVILGGIAAPKKIAKV